MDDDFHGGGGPADCWEDDGYGPSQLGREPLRGIPCSLSQVNGGCCMVGAPRIWVSTPLATGSLCDLEHVA